jgi:SET domain-containing protein
MSQNETITVPIIDTRGSDKNDHNNDQSEFSNSINWLPPSKIKVGNSFKKDIGRGVFATKDIESGEIVERCPMVQLSFRTRYHHDPQLSRYLYTQASCPCEQCKIHGAYMYMVLGYGMIYNHQDDPNTEWYFHYNEKYSDVIATRPIKEGEEIFVSYGGNYFTKRPYFDKNGSDRNLR